MNETIWNLLPIVIFAGLLRGYAGFGFAAVAIVGFNFFLPPQQGVPVILALDVLCSAGLWQQAKKQADIPTFKLLALGAILGIPVGLALLIFIPETTLKLLICIAILLFTLALLFDLRVKSTETLKTKLAFGLASGIGTAGASVGGPMILSYMLSSKLSSVVQRATMILFFMVSETLALIAIVASGLISFEIAKLLAILLLPTMLAVRAGQWLFNRKPPKSLKHFALPIMGLAALLGISASIGALLQ
ncbi:sulfite exporter TauE/SafE family protein [Reinekea marinisedimentorum]|uniref:Probable membrane transporter protein n=1 Tax=Reinekea marinisedimentorum TaxID=230495 RepID=A0A4R3IA12_9GAMM|nr:sulfite exporter TauE/SafE family protein [Reinekea marinisedimentorum]TCS43120.1 hypothetical protein BCF53_102144 [Reinekea marinisedimentorum]